MQLSLLSFLSVTGLLATGSHAASASLRTRGLVEYNGISTNDGFNENLGQCNGALCGIWGDPHIITCDGLTYDCQGTGLFTMMKNHVWNIQGHFLPVGASEMKLVIDQWHKYPEATQTNDIIIEYVPSSQGIDRKLAYQKKNGNNNSGSGSSSDDENCGCSTCDNSVWNTEAGVGKYKCGARINYSQKKLGDNERESCIRVATEYPDECGGCDPDQCDKSDSNDYISEDKMYGGVAPTTYSASGTDSELVPTMQFSFPDLSAHDGLVPSEEGCLVGFHYEPMNMEGHGRSTEPSLQACRERCEGIEGCVKFSYHGDGGCRPQDENSLMVSTPSNWSRSVAGPVHKCGKELPRTKTTKEFPFASTQLESRTKGNNCPFNFYLGGELQDISNLEAGGYLYGDAQSDHSAKLDGDTRIRVSHKTESGAISEAMLQVTGDGPGELFACHWDFWVCLPQEDQDRFEEFSVGLFGSPDGNRQNDWMDVTAQPLAIPSDERGRGAFDYCHENWCVSEEDSLMTYPEGTTYGDHKCVDEEYVPFDVNNEICVISAQKIINKCADKPPSLVHPCQVECCYGGCNTFDEVEEQIVELVTLDTEEEEQDLIFDPPVVAEEPLCFSTGDKVATSDKVCPASPDGIVQIVHQSSDKLPADGDQDIIYGIVMEEAKDDNIGQSVKFRVDNIFATEADVYVRYEKKVGEFANDPACESMPNTKSGCDVDATEIEVGCVEFPNVEPFALVDIYFVSNKANSFIPMNAAADTAVEKCCKPPDAYQFDQNGYGVLKYTLKIQCSCPTIAVE